MRTVVYHVHLPNGKLYLRGVFVCVVLGAGADGVTERVEDVSLLIMHCLPR